MVRKEEFFVELFLEFIAVVLLDFIPGFWKFFLVDPITFMNLSLNSKYL